MKLSLAEIRAAYEAAYGNPSRVASRVWMVNQLLNAVSRTKGRKAKALASEEEGSTLIVSPKDDEPDVSVSAAPALDAPSASLADIPEAEPRPSVLEGNALAGLEESPVASSPVDAPMRGDEVSGAEEAGASGSNTLFNSGTVEVDRVDATPVVESGANGPAMADEAGVVDLPDAPVSSVHIALAELVEGGGQLANDGSRPEPDDDIALRERYRAMSTESLREVFESVTGRQTDSQDRRYLIGKIRNFERARPTRAGLTPKAAYEAMTIEELQQTYLRVVGRPTGSSSRGYLIWKISATERGELPAGPIEGNGRRPGAPDRPRRRDGGFDAQAATELADAGNAATPVRRAPTAATQRMRSRVAEDRPFLEGLEGLKALIRVLVREAALALGEVGAERAASRAAPPPASLNVTPPPVHPDTWGVRD